MFVPQYQYGYIPQRIEVVVSDGEVEFDLDRQTVLYRGYEQHKLTMPEGADSSTKNEVM